MAALLFSLFCYGLILSFQTAYSEENCGTIGMGNKTAVPSRDQYFVLSTHDPASCSGSIKDYQFCYYSSTDVVNSTQEGGFSFSIFRQNSSGDYHRVYEAIPVSADIIFSNTTQLYCSTMALPDMLSVKEGDVFGACISSVSTTIVGNCTELNPESFLHVVDNSECGDSFPTILKNETLTRTEGLVLHLYTNIINSSSAPSSPSPEELAAIIVPLVSVAVLAILVVIIFWCCKKVLVSDSSTEPLFQSTSQGTDNIGYCDVAIAQPLLGTRNGSTRNRKTQVDSSTYENLDTDLPSSLYTPPTTTEEETSSLDANTNVDSGSYAEVRTSPRHRPSRRPRTATVDTVDETVQRRVYEFESSRSQGVSFECSLENVNHYESMVPGLEYLHPTDTLPRAHALTITDLLEMNKEEDIYSNVDPYQRPASMEGDLLTQLKSCGVLTLSEDNIEVKGNIGMGQFGTVHKGVWKKKGQKATQVALKSLKQGSSKGDKVMFLQEAAIMAQFRHPNITMLYGVIVESQPMMLVVELAAKGDLRNLLLSIRPEPDEVPPEELRKLLLQFSQQVALGMQYLSAKGFVHRDLAARNILVSKTNVCKVADFGLSRDLATEKYYVSEGRDKIPVKWTAPEAIQYKKYSTASDVWAYGCLLYEIWSLGHKPFEGVSNIQVLKVINSGKRLHPPPGCPKMIYELMTISWHPETSQRPSFRDIVLTLVGSEKMVLNIPEEDSSANPLAGVLGAPLEAGENMYSELFKRYLDADD